MKAVKTMLLALLVSISAVASDLRDEVVVETDRFTGRTKISYQPTPKSDPSGLDLILLSVVEPEKPLDAQAVSITLATSSDGWKYLDCHRLDWLADGKPVMVGDAEHEGSVLDGGGVLEMIGVYTDAKRFGQLARAQSVEYRLCNDEVQMSPAHSSAIRDFYAKLQEASK